MAADAGGEVVDVEEALEEVGVLDLVLQLVQDGDLPVHQRLQAPGEVDEDLQFLFAARLAGELGGPDDGGDGAVVGAGQVGGEQFEVVGVVRRSTARFALGRGLAAAQRLDHGAQIALRARGAAAQGAHAVVHGPRGAVGGDGGDDDGREGHRDRPREHAPQDEAGPGAGGPNGEQDDRAGAEGVAQGDRPAVHVHPVEVGTGLLLPGQHHAREGLVDLEQVDVAEGERRPAQHLLGGRDHARQHQQRVGARDGEAVQAGERAQAEAGGGLARRDQHGRCAVVDRTGVAGGDVPLDLRETLGEGRVVVGGLEAGEDLDAAGGAYALVARDAVEGRDLGVEAAGVPGLGGLVVGGDGEGVHPLPGERPLGGDQLGADALRNESLKVAGGDAGAEGVRAGRHVGPHGHPAHRLDPAGDDEIVRPGHDALRGEVDGLLGGTALAVHGGRGDGLGEAGRQEGVAGGVHGLLADLVDGAADDVVDQHRVDTRAFDEGPQSVREELHGMDVREGAVRPALAHGGAYGFDDDCVTHGADLRWPATTSE